MTVGVRFWGIAIRAGVSIVAILLALATIGVILAFMGVDPIRTYIDMAHGSLGDPYSLTNTVTKTIPRLIPALGIVIALRAGLWNIGAEGQLWMGAVGATAVALFGPPLPFPLAPIVALVAGTIAGGLWAAPAGLLRARRGVSEVITSLMLVYVAIQIASYLVQGPWLPAGETFPRSGPVPDAARLPTLIPRTLINAGVLVAGVAVIATWVLLRRTILGLHLKAVGGNPQAAHHAGVRVGRSIVWAMVISGALAGITGAVEVLGSRGRLVQGFSPGYGFEAIAVALLGQGSPIGVIGAAALFGALDAGGTSLRAAAQGVPAAIVQVAEGLSVMYVLVAFGIVQFLQRRIAARAALAAERTGTRAEQATSARGP